MNGRVYDYNVGRFMSVDPFIQGSGSQGINPYSYVMNNPLGYTDPSGYSAIKTGSVCENRQYCGSAYGYWNSGQKAQSKEDNGASHLGTFISKGVGQDIIDWSKEAGESIGIEEGDSGNTSKIKSRSRGTSGNQNNPDFSTARNHDELLAMAKGEEYVLPSKVGNQDPATEFIRVTTLTSGVSGLDNVTFDGEDLIQLKADSVTFGAELFYVDIHAYPVDSNGKMITIIEPQGVRHSMKQSLIGGFNSGGSVIIDVKTLNWDVKLFQNFRWKVQIPTQQQIHQNSNGRSVTIYKKETSE